MSTSAPSTQNSWRNESTRPRKCSKAEPSASSPPKHSSTMRTWSASASSLTKPPKLTGRRNPLALEETLRAAKIEFHCETENPPEAANPLKLEVLEGVKRWFYNDWRRIENKLRTSIVEGISVFLSLFDDNPMVKRTFCPPKECYDPKLNANGIMMKLDFQRAVLNRIPNIEKNPKRYLRQVFFICDEYQRFATVGENDP